jgi:hypothetical protein
MEILQKNQMKPIIQQGEAVPTNHKKDKYNHPLISKLRCVLHECKFELEVKLAY